MRLGQDYHSTDYKVICVKRSINSQVAVASSDTARNNAPP
jgi:hypothetical protein